MKNNIRRPVKTEGLNSKELETWINQNGERKAAIKCQILIALCNGSRMTDVCEIFNVTRETVRVWRNAVVSKGIKGLIKYSSLGRKTQLTTSLKKKLKKIIAKPPHSIGFKNPRWSGKVFASYLEKEHNIKISIRTAQVWIKLKF